MLMLNCAPTSATAIAMLLALVASPSRRGVSVTAFRITLQAPTICQNPYRGVAAIVSARERFSSLTPLSNAKHSQEDYSSLKVSELRELLRDRGLAVSGIKAQLVERLATGKPNKGKVRTEPRKEIKSKQMHREDNDRLDDDLKGLDSLHDDGEDDLAGIFDQLKTVERRDSNDGGKEGNKKNEEKVVKRNNEQRLGKRDNQGNKIRKRNIEEKIGKRNREEKIDPNRRPGNLVFAKEEDEDDDEWDDSDDDDGRFNPNQTVGAPRHETQNKRKERNENVTFKDDFQGTRVFVQGLPADATWKELKDHFKVVGDVVYASVSIDKKTGRSKQCGLVQFETPSMAEEAIREMRNHPMNGEQLYVRKDVQESRTGNSGGNPGGRGGADERYGYSEKKSALPTEWKRANDKAEDGSGDDWYNLKDEELKEIESLIEKRDKQRRQKNFKMSDQFRYQLKDEFGVHLDDRLKLWWTDTKHGGVPGVVSDIKGEGNWGKQKPWKQIPTNSASDAMVDSDFVMELLVKRDRARKRKDFDTADELLQKAHDSPQGLLGLRIHDESRTWRIWTERPPPRKFETPDGYEKLSPEEMCLQIVTENEPEKVDETRQLLKKFPGREWNIFKRLKERYNASS